MGGGSSKNHDKNKAGGNDPVSAGNLTSVAPGENQGSSTPTSKTAVTKSSPSEGAVAGGNEKNQKTDNKPNGQAGAVAPKASVQPKQQQQVGKKKITGTARYELFRYEDSEVLTYVGEDGQRIYEDDKGGWRTFPNEWEALGEFVSADQPVIVTWTSADGTSYETYLDDDGTRYYCDFDLEKWMPFKPEWEGTGTFHEVQDRSKEDSAFGTFSHLGTTYTTYEADEVVKVTYYFDEDSNEWVKLPEEWKLASHAVAAHQGADRPMTAAALVRSQTSSGLQVGNALLGSPAVGAGGAAGGAASSAVVAQKDKEIAELKAKVESLVEKGNRNIEKAKKKIKAVEDKAEAERIQLEARIKELELEVKAGQSGGAERVAKLEKEVQQLRFSAADSMKQSLADKDKEIGTLSTRLAAAEKQIASAKVQGAAAVKTIFARCKRLLEEARELRKLSVDARNDTRELKSLVAPSFKEMERLMSDRLSGVVSEIGALKAKYRAEMLQRKLLFNKIQELKGNIRVFCRCRGLSKKELAEGYEMCVAFPETGEISVTDEKGIVKNFEFDFVFGPTATQANVFEDTCPLITSVMDGYNVCIFAYGQTGAGKTYTMMGIPGNLGVNYRSLEELFKITKERSDEWNYSIHVSFLEIYNESIRDLLAKKGGEGEKLEIRQGPAGNFVPGLIEHEARSIADVDRIIEQGDKARSTSATAMNEVSSRSHSVLQIRIEGENRMTRSKSLGKLTLCDLAGSERVGRSEATGQRLIEAAAINKSLSSLGNVMAALAAGQQHVPYRDSKLTYLLQDSLGGDSKTAFFVNCSPSSSNADETIQTLNFGKRLRNVSLGPVSKNVVPEGGGGAPAAPPPGKGKGKGKGLHG